MDDWLMLSFHFQWSLPQLALVLLYGQSYKDVGVVSQIALQDPLDGFAWS